MRFDHHCGNNGYNQHHRHKNGHNNNDIYKKTSTILTEEQLYYKKTFI